MRRLIGILLAVVSGVALAGPATVLYDHDVVRVDETLADATDLWVRPSDLPRVNGFELKPEGACLDQICVPVRQDADSDLFVRRGGQSWFNVTGLASKIGQPNLFSYPTATRHAS